MLRTLTKPCQLVLGYNCNNIYNRNISTTGVRNLIQKYRQEKGLPLNPNTCGPLTDSSDYTYLDGRATPLGMRQKKRMLKQREIAVKIITLSKEIDFAVERHNNILKTEQEKREKILSNKLKPKGHLLKEDTYE